MESWVHGRERKTYRPEIFFHLVWAWLQKANATNFCIPGLVFLWSKKTSVNFIKGTWYKCLVTFQVAQKCCAITLRWSFSLWENLIVALLRRVCSGGGFAVPAAPPTPFTAPPHPLLRRPWEKRETLLWTVSRQALASSKLGRGWEPSRVFANL